MPAARETVAAGNPRWELSRGVERVSLDPPCNTYNEALNLSEVGSAAYYSFNGTAIDFRIYTTPGSPFELSMSVDYLQTLTVSLDGPRGCSIVQGFTDLDPHQEHNLEVGILYTNLTNIWAPLVTSIVTFPLEDSISLTPVPTETTSTPSTTESRSDTASKPSNTTTGSTPSTAPSHVSDQPSLSQTTSRSAPSSSQAPEPAPSGAAGRPPVAVYVATAVAAVVLAGAALAVWFCVSRRRRARRHMGHSGSKPHAFDDTTVSYSVGSVVGESTRSSSTPADEVGKAAAAGGLRPFPAHGDGGVVGCAASPARPKHRLFGKGAAGASAATVSPGSAGPSREDGDGDGAMAELYTAMRQAGFTVHTLFDRLRHGQPPGVEASPARATNEQLPRYV